MPGKISSPAAILRIRLARISSLTERGRYPDALSSPTVVGLDMPAPVWAGRPGRTSPGGPDDAIIVVCQLEGHCQDGRLPGDVSIWPHPAVWTARPRGADLIGRRVLPTRTAPGDRT